MDEIDETDEINERPDRRDRRNRRNDETDEIDEIDEIDDIPLDFQPDSDTMLPGNRTTEPERNGLSSSYGNLHVKRTFPSSLRGLLPLRWNPGKAGPQSAWRDPRSRAHAQDWRPGGVEE